MEINFSIRRFKDIISIFKLKNSSPKTELYYINDFTLLIAVMLSAQCTDKIVNSVTYDLFKKYNSAKDFATLSIEKIEILIKKINFHKTKARNLFMISKILLTKEIPSKIEELTLLPGVGIKTASVFLSATNKAHLIAVDTHVFRVLNRIGLFYVKKASTTYKIVNNLIEKEERNNFHHWIILHGRYICKANKPLCIKCEINKFCFKNFV